MRTLLGVCLLALAGAAAAAGMELQIIELEHRLARDVLPLIGPLVSPGGTLTGTDNRVILRTDAANLAEIERVIATLDVRVRQLRISVAQGRDAATLASGHVLGARIESGDLAAGVGVPAAPGAGSGAQYRSIGTQSREAVHATQFVLTMEGQPAYIDTGADIPQPYAEVTPSPYRSGIGTGIEYRNVGSGFYAIPRLHGEDVTVDIAQRLERMDAASGAIRTAGGGATVTGRLGEWIPIGGAVTGGALQDSSTIASTRRTGDDAYTVWIKIEEQP